MIVQIAVQLADVAEVCSYAAFISHFLINLVCLCDILKRFLIIFLAVVNNSNIAERNSYVGFIINFLINSQSIEIVFQGIRIICLVPMNNSNIAKYSCC